MEVAAHAGVRPLHGLRALQHEDALGLVVMGGGSVASRLQHLLQQGILHSSAKFISIPAFLQIVSPLYHVPPAVARKIFCRGLTSVCRTHIILHNKYTAQTCEKEK